MTKKRAEFLTGYEIRTIVRAAMRCTVAAFEGEQIVLERSAITEHLALKALVEAVYRLHCGRVLKQYGDRCARCRVRRPLQIHHKRYRPHGGTHRIENLEPVCWECHRMIHEVERSK